MSTSNAVIQFDENHATLWHGNFTDPPEYIDVSINEPKPGVETIVSRCQSFKPTIASAILTIPSHICLTARIATQDLPRKDRYSALLFRLEAELPIAAEELTATFIEHRHDALGIALRTDRLQSWLEGFESNGVQIDHIYPEPMFLMTGLLSRSPDIASHANVLLVRDQGMDLFKLTDHGIVDWHWFGNDARALHAYCQVQQHLSQTQFLLHVITFDLTEIPEPIMEFAGSQLSCQTSEIITLANQHHDLSRSSSCVNLRCGPLSATDPLRRSRSILRFATATVALLMLATALGLWQRGNQYQSAARQTKTAIADIYMRTAGSATSPPSSTIRLRLEAEHRRFQALAGENADLAPQPAALEQLGQLMRRLPTQLRYRILDIQIDPDRIHLDGEARQHSDANQIAVALRRQNGFSIDPPRTEQLRDKGVSFSITGLPLASPASTSTPNVQKGSINR